MSQTVYHLLLDTIQRASNYTAAHVKKQGEWQSLTWNDIFLRTEGVSQGLLALNVAPKDRIGIVSKTRLEWSLSDFGILGVGACTVPVYPSSTAEETGYILNDAQVKIVIVDDLAQLQKLRKAQKAGLVLEQIICIEESEVNDWAPNEMAWSAFIKNPARVPLVKEVSDRLENVGPGDLATIVYTSGTTGLPKGVMLTHDNLLFEASIISKVGLIYHEEIQLLFLPLAHIFAKIVQIAWVCTAHQMAYAESIDKVMENMQEIKPTLVAAVPRIYEKIHARVIETALQERGIKRAIVRWGLRKGQEAAQKEQQGLSANSVEWSLAQKLVFEPLGAKLREKLGGKIRIFISGGAPLAKDIGYFFKYAGITICEGYGLTETSAATCVNLPDALKVGTVGRPVPGMEVQIADDGEVLIRGRGVFHGYWNKPLETEEAFTSDGWFKSGDIGVIDKDGYVRITDRKKDIIVTAGGKKVAPQKIENILKTQSPLISQVIVFGDAKPYLTAMVTVDEIALNGFAVTKDLKGDYQKLLKNQLVTDEVGRVILATNHQLASYEQIKKFIVLDHDLVVGEELTPTLKVKRKECYRRYGQQLEALYA